MDKVQVGIAMVTAVMEDKEPEVTNAIESYFRDGLSADDMAVGVLVVAGMMAREWRRQGGNPLEFLQGIGIQAGVR